MREPDTRFPNWLLCPLNFEAFHGTQLQRVVLRRTCRCFTILFVSAVISLLSRNSYIHYYTRSHARSTVHEKRNRQFRARKIACFETVGTRNLWQNLSFCDRFCHTSFLILLTASPSASSSFSLASSESESRLMVGAERGGGGGGGAVHRRGLRLDAHLAVRVAALALRLQISHHRQEVHRALAGGLHGPAATPSAAERPTGCSRAKCSDAKRNVLQFSTTSGVTLTSPQARLPHSMPSSRVGRCARRSSPQRRCAPLASATCWSRHGTLPWCGQDRRTS